jgi:hypothetical protein
VRMAWSSAHMPGNTALTPGIAAHTRGNDAFS